MVSTPRKPPLSSHPHPQHLTIAPFYVAALTYHSPLWTMAAINFAIAILIAGTLGLWIGGFQRGFWIPFCFVGWLYFAISFTPSTMNRLVDSLPSTHLGLAMTTDTQDSSGPGIGARVGSTVSGWVSYSGSVDVEGIAAASRLTDILHALLALVFGTLAGIVACVLLRQKPASK